MKQNVKQFLATGLAVLSILSISACNKKEESASYPENTATATAVNLRYTATKYESSSANYKSTYAFYDETYYYYMFYLGQVRRVPLQDNAVVYEYSGSAFSKEFSTQTVNETTVSQMVSNVQSECIEVSVGTKVEANYEEYLFLAKINAGITVEGKESAANTTTQSQSYENAKTYSESASETTAFSFDENSAHGFYRYILLGDLEVFGVLVKNIQTGEYYAETYEILVAQYYTLDYSTTSTFNDHEKSFLSFELTEEEIENLPVPEVNISEADEELGEDVIDISKLEVIYDPAPFKQAIVDTGFVYEEFNINELSNYMTGEYNLVFEVQIMISEKNDGYQEIHLYNKNGTWLAGLSDYTHGGNDADDTILGVTLKWRISGNNCTDIMKLGYTAHGLGADVWYKHDVKVIVTVERK